MRPEQDIFEELEQLCASPGYAHVIAYLCFRDNLVGYSKEITVKDLQKLFSPNRLVRTEVSTLIGLLIKHEIDYTLPSVSMFYEYVRKTEALLEELHHAMMAPMFEGITPEKIAGGFNPFDCGQAMREPIFYGGESAYNFQYRDLAQKKYKEDEKWMMVNTGFSIESARNIVYAVQKLQEEKLIATLSTLRTLPPEEWTILPAFSFTSDQISERSGIQQPKVEKILDAFAVPKSNYNSNFRSLNDFNVATTTPMLRVDDGTFILFQSYDFAQAIYETPFYWMGDDNGYSAKAMHHRGRFTEQFCQERLELVFGKQHVYSNVKIVESKRSDLGEIDLLVIFANRAIVLQAKSKRLTIEARKGNDGVLRDDFKKSIQESYDQASKCAELLLNRKHTLLDGDGKEIKVPAAIKELYIFCVVADHYPALSFQARQFLKFATTDVIFPPFVLDVFTLDALTEMLQSPLRFLSYVNRRTQYFKKLLASHELTILSYHLKSNLWVEDKHDLITLSDDISTDLDLAMLARRDGIPGAKTPDGVLTRLTQTHVGRLIQQIEAQDHPGTIDLGFMLLSLSEKTVNEINRAINQMQKLAAKDGAGHDATIGIEAGNTGLTIHCNDDFDHNAALRLRNHCELRKYTEKAETWFGLCVRPNDAFLRFGLSINHKWQQEPQMDALTQRFVSLRNLEGKSMKMRKVGRNDPCPCGSGLKYKKCHLNR